jgi:hypothetical protein
MTPMTLKKLEEVFSYDATIEEACLYADISPETYYAYLRVNPGFSDRVKLLRQRPVLKARRTVVSGLDDATNAKWYLERKVKREFAQRNEVSGPGDNPIQFLLGKYGFNEDDTDDRKGDGAIQGALESGA